MADPLAGLYQQLILDHARERHGYGPLAAPTAQQHEMNPTCGDEVTVQLALDPEGRISEFGWEGQGCSISMASVSVLHDLAVGKTPSEMLALTAEFRDMLRSRGADEGSDELGDAVAFHGVAKFVMRVKCAMLGWVAMEGCLAQTAAAS